MLVLVRKSIYLPNVIQTVLDKETTSYIPTVEEGKHVMHHLLHAVVEGVYFFFSPSLGVVMV